MFLRSYSSISMKSLRALEILDVHQTLGMRWSQEIVHTGAFSKQLAGYVAALKGY
jgi:hypothetical protein